VAGVAALLARRLEAHGLGTSRFAGPADVVRALGAVQAQEPPGAAWAIAQRTTEPSRDAVAAALDAGDVLRSHALRPTWHILARDDLRWMQAATAERVERAVGTWYREFGLDAAELERTDRIIEAALPRDGARTRPELTAELAAAGVDTAEPVRVQHILLHAEVACVITSGPMRGTVATYALVDDRAPASGALRPADPLAELARRYLAGHGPASAGDFAWWSGMTLTAARAAIASIAGGLRTDTVDGIEYWSLADAPDAAEPAEILLLPAYDEFVVGYADRSQFTPEGFTGNPVFQNVIVRRGVIAGTWEPNAAGCAPEFITAPSSADRAALAAAVERYEHFRAATPRA
jgi:hypothetical protein